MRLNAFFLADAVSAPPDGKFYIHGGGLTRLTVPGTPFLIPQLGVFVRLETEESEIGETHEFKFEFRDPDGEPVGPIQLPQFSAQLPPPPAGAPEPEDGEQRFVILAINIGGLSVGRRGLHTFGFLVDGEPMGEISLPVVVQNPGLHEAPMIPIPPPPSTGSTGRPVRSRPSDRQRPRR